MGHGHGTPASALLRWSVIAAAALLVSCGGGGGGGGSGGGGGTSSNPGQPAAANQPPAFTSATRVSYVENGTGAVYQAIAGDPEGKALTYTITGGLDAARFTISGAGELRFVASPNYDLPGDSDRDGVYSVQIAASDGQASATLNLLVTVTNDKEGIAVHRVATNLNAITAIAPVSDRQILLGGYQSAIYLLDLDSGVSTLLAQPYAFGLVYALLPAPDFATTGSFFVAYRAQNARLMLARYVRDAQGRYAQDPLATFTGDAEGPSSGGWLGFDRNGNLLMAISDEENPSARRADPAQDPSSPFGKLLRLVRNGNTSAAGNNYDVTILASGLHQPTGGFFYNDALLLADRGKAVTSAADEVNLIPLGNSSGNYGWPYKEGTQTTSGTPPAGTIDPVLQYKPYRLRNYDALVVGGVIGTGVIPSLAGQYIFGDTANGVFTIPAASLVQGRTLDDTAIEHRLLDFVPDVGSLDHPQAFALSPSGRLYILGGNGEIFRVDRG